MMLYYNVWKKKVVGVNVNVMLGMQKITIYSTMILFPDL